MLYFPIIRQKWHHPCDVTQDFLEKLPNCPHQFWTNETNCPNSYPEKHNRSIPVETEVPEETLLASTSGPRTTKPRRRGKICVICLLFCPGFIFKWACPTCEPAVFCCVGGFCRDAGRLRLASPCLHRLATADAHIPAGRTAKPKHTGLLWFWIFPSGPSGGPLFSASPFSQVLRWGCLICFYLVLIVYHEWLTHSVMKQHDSENSSLIIGWDSVLFQQRPMFCWYHGNRNMNISLWPCLSSKSAPKTDIFILRYWKSRLRFLQKNRIFALLWQVGNKVKSR